MSGDISLGFDINILDLGEELWDTFSLYGGLMPLNNWL